ncbi:uncharacterized protein LOC135399294 isoform X2 [Ornithodoros turicata]|uniref:uncharacterized protein LOC135399294 isoform X2 n=1 Tax=Ornithodoros turicata TaxID=34597 RepID=UPI0031398C79
MDSACGAHPQLQERHHSPQDYTEGEDENDPLALVILPPLSPQSCLNSTFPEEKTWCPRACLSLVELGLMADTAWGPEDAYQGQVRELWLAYHRQQSPNTYVQEARKLSWGMGRRNDILSEESSRTALTLKELGDLWNSIVKVQFLWKGCSNKDVELYHRLSTLLKTKVSSTEATVTASGDCKETSLNIAKRVFTEHNGDADSIQRYFASQTQSFRGILSPGGTAEDESSDDLYSEQTTDRDDDVTSYNDSDYDTWTDNESAPDSEDGRQSPEDGLSFCYGHSAANDHLCFNFAPLPGCETWVPGVAWSHLKDGFDKQSPQSSSTSTQDTITPTQSLGSSLEKKSWPSSTRLPVSVSRLQVNTTTTAGSVGIPRPEHCHQPYYLAPKHAPSKPLARLQSNTVSYPTQTTSWPALPTIQRIAYLPAAPNYSPASLMVLQKCPPPQTIPQGYIHHPHIPVLPQSAGFILPPLQMVRSQPPPTFFVQPNSSVAVMKTASRSHYSAWSYGGPVQPPPPPPPPTLPAGPLHHHHHAARHVPTVVYGKYEARQRAVLPSYSQGSLSVMGDAKACTAKSRLLKKGKCDASSFQDDCLPTSVDVNR